MNGPVKPYDDYYQNAVKVANRLILERDGDLDGPAQEFDFNVRHNVSTENLRLQIGDFILWDSDDDGGADDVEVIMKIAKERLVSLAESFKRWL